MAHVSIIGTGNMGSAISALVTKGGHTVEAFNSADVETLQQLFADTT